MIYIDSDVLDAFMNFANQKTVIRIEKGDERIVVQDNSMSFYLVAMVNGSLEYVGSEAYPTITQNDVIANGLSINRYVSNPNGIGFGSVVPAELNVTFNNAEGKYDSSIFEDAEITVEIMVEGFEDRPVKFGRYIVDEVRYSGTNIELTAFDRLILMDVFADLSGITLPTTAAGLIGYVCNACGITISSDVTLANLPNADYVISKLPDGDYTYRQYLKWLLELCGSNAMMNEKDELYIGWYSWGMFPMTELTPQNRFSSTRAEKQLSLNCVTVANALTGNVATSTEYAPGGYAISVSGNPFITHDEQTVADNICTPIGGYSWYPFEAATVPIPSLMPMDRIGFTDKAGNTVYTIVSDVTFALGQNTQIAGKGETAAYKRRVTNNYNSTEQYLASRIDNVYVPGTKDIDGQKLAVDSVTADKIAVNSLQAISAILGGFTIVDNNISALNSSTDITQNPQIKLERNTGNAYEYAYVIYSFPTYELYFRDFQTAAGSHYPTDIKISISDKGSLSWQYNQYPSTGSALPTESDYQATPTNTYNNTMGLPLELGGEQFTAFFGNGAEISFPTGKNLTMRKSSVSYGENEVLNIDGRLKASSIECSSFTNIRHDKRSITINAGQGNGYAITAPTSSVGDDPIVQITCDNRLIEVGYSVSTSGPNTVIIVSGYNNSGSSQTGVVCTTMFYHNS